MEKVKIVSIILFLFFCLPALAQDGPAAAGIGLPETEAEADLEAPGPAVEETAAQIPGKARSLTELKEMIRNKRNEQSELAPWAKKTEWSARENQRPARSAAFALEAMESLSGDAGPEIARLARSAGEIFENIAQSEEKIYRRNWLAAFLFGGDHAAAGAIDGDIKKNQEHLKQMKDIVADWQGETELKEIAENELKAIEEELNRLLALVQAERNNQGFFGFIRNLLLKITDRTGSV